MNELGKTIRQIRKTKKITLIELAKLTGVAQASLSRIETGVMTGTIESHKKISEALGTSVADLYAGLDNRLAEVEQVEPTATTHTVLTDAISLNVLTTNTSGKKIVPVVYTLKANSTTQDEQLERGVERFVWVVSGEIKINIDGKLFLLQERNSIYFDASLKHHLKNDSSDTAEVFCATSPPRI